MDIIVSHTSIKKMPGLARTNTLAFILIVLLFILTCIPAWAQNLVPNPGFEEHVACPVPSYYMMYCKDWRFTYHEGNLYDGGCYYTDCTTHWGLPVKPHGGNSYAGEQSWFYGGSDPNFMRLANYRLYLQDTLTEVLKKNTCYHIGCYVRTAKNSPNLSDNFGIYMGSHSPVFLNYSGITPAQPQIYWPKGRLIDSSSWHLLEGWYMAKGGEKLITISEFADDAHTLTMPPVNTKSTCTHFIYVDDVFVEESPCRPYTPGIGADTVLCHGQTLTLHTGIASHNPHVRWQDGTNADSFVVAKPGTYWVYNDTASFYSADTIHVGYDSVPANGGPQKLFACNFPYTLVLPHKGITYHWPGGKTGDSFVIAKPGIYNYRASKGHCAVTGVIDASIPTVALSGFPLDTIVCALPASVKAASRAGLTYSWPDGGTADKITVTVPGTYLYTALYTVCKINDSITVALYRKPEIQLPADTSVCYPDTIKIDLTSVQGPITWQDGSREKKYSIYRPGAYRFTSHSPCGNIDETINVSETGCGCMVSIPNAFSPDGNKTNDLFKPEFTCWPTNFDLKVYNRWGELVFRATDPAIAWDGTFNGVKCPEGVYFWYALYKFPGHIAKLEHGNLMLFTQ